MQPAFVDHNSVMWFVSISLHAHGIQRVDFSSTNPLNPIADSFEIDNHEIALIPSVTQNGISILENS